MPNNLKNLLPKIIVKAVKEKTAMLSSTIDELPREYRGEFKRRKEVSTKTVVLISYFVYRELENLNSLLFEKLTSKHKETKGLYYDAVDSRRLIRALFRQRSLSKEILHLFGYYAYRDQWELVQKDILIPNGLERFIGYSERKSNQTVVSLDEVVGNLKNTYSKHPFSFITSFGSLFENMNLSMDDYYTDVSFVNSESIRSNEQILQFEKKNYDSQKKYSHYHLNDKQLNSYFINDYQSLLILGNPGIGKTTFAKWICYQWATDQFISDKPILYVNLKNIAEAINFTSIINYLKEYYFKQNEKKRVFENTITCSSFYYLFDGFDELSLNQRIDLHSWIIKERDKISFALLSRPYALINVSYQFEQLIEIIGFSDASRLDISEKLIKNHAEDYEDKTVADFWDIVLGNHMLNEFAHNPMMLSYMLIIYIYSGKSHQTKLQNIESSFELFQLTIQSIQKHFINKNLRPDAEEFFEQTMFDSQDLALWMEEQKLFVISIDKPLLASYGGIKLLKKTNAIGIGKLTQANYLTNQRFHFISASFQEYLASISYVNKANFTKFDDFLKDTLHWNFCRFVIGCATASFEFTFLSITGQKLYNHWRKGSPNVPRLYHLLLFFSEVNSEMVNQTFKSEDFRTILDQYIIASINTSWQSLLVDVLSKIISKFNHATFTLFVEGYIKYLDEKVSQFEKTKLPKEIELDIQDLILLGTASKLNSSQTLISSILNWINTLNNISYSSKIGSTQIDLENLTFEELLNKEKSVVIHNSIMAILHLLEESTLDVLVENEVQISELINPNSQKYLEEGLHFPITHIIERIESLENLLPEFRSLVENPEEFSINSTLILLERIGNQCLLYNSPISQKESLGLVEKLYKYVKDQIYNDDREELVSGILYILASLNTLSALTLFCAIIRLEDTATRVFEVKNSILFQEVLINEFPLLYDNKIVSEEINIQTLLHFLNIISRVTSCSYFFSKNRKSLILFFKHIVYKYYEKLQANHRLIEEDDNKDYPIIPIPEQVTEFLDLFHSIILKDDFFDKRFFLNEIFNDRRLTENNYVKYISLLDFFAYHRDIPFYNLQYWDYLYQLIDVEYEPFYIIEIATNNTIYHTIENFEKMIPVLSYLYKTFDSNREKILKEKNLSIIFSLIFQTYYRLKRNTGVTRTVHNKMTVILSKILEIDEIKAYLDPEFSEEIYSYGIVSYVIRIYFTPEQDASLNHVSLHNNYDVGMISTLIKLVLDKKEFDYIKTRIPKNISDRILKHYDFFEN